MDINTAEAVDTLRTDIRRVETSLTGEINRVETTMTGEIKRVETTLTARIDDVEASLATKIEIVETSLNARIEHAETSLSAKIDDAKRHADIGFESVRDDIRMLAEGFATLSAQIDARRQQNPLPLSLSLCTARLTLRDFVPDDFDAIHTYASDPEVTRFMFHGPRTVEDTREYLDRMLASQTLKPRLIWELAVAVTSSDRLVGACDLACKNELEADLGFIFSKDVWGRGYATEAARAMVRAGFEELSLTRIFSTCDIANAASARVLEKAGLTRVATLERHKYALGKWWTSYLYEIRSGR